MTDLSEREARRSVQLARRSLEAAADEVVRQVEGRAWIALGYADWDEMRQAEYRGIAVIVPGADRPELSGRLVNAGLSQQQTADTLGVDQGTVSRDVMQMHNVPVTRTDSLGRRQPTHKPHAETPPAEPAPAVTEWLAADTGLADRQFIAEFARVVARSDDFMEFEPDRVGLLADEHVMHVLDDLPGRVERYVAKVKAARSGLRLIEGEGR